MGIPDLDASVRILNSAGALVLDLTEAAGYDLVDLGVPDRTWRRIVATSAFVDGEHLVQAVLEGGVHVVAVQVSGATWSQIQTRRQALIDAVEVWAWLLEVTISGGRCVWRATRADSSNPVDKFQAIDRWNQWAPKFFELVGLPYVSAPKLMPTYHQSETVSP